MKGNTRPPGWTMWESAPLLPTGIGNSWTLLMHYPQTDLRRSSPIIFYGSLSPPPYQFLPPMFMHVRLSLVTRFSDRSFLCPPVPTLSAPTTTPATFHVVKAGVHLKAVSTPHKIGLMEISRSRFKQSKNSLLIL